MFNQRLHHSTFYFCGGVLLMFSAVVLGLGAFWSFQAGKVGMGLFGTFAAPSALLLGIRGFRAFRMRREEEKLWDPTLR
jgi:hypothetical protein